MLDNAEKPGKIFNPDDLFLHPSFAKRRARGCAIHYSAEAFVSQEPTIWLEYDADRAIDGVMTPLLYPLRGVLEFDRLHINQNLLAQAYLTVFRRQAKRLFHVKLLRQGGKWVVQMGGGDPAEVLAAIRVCRDHFDDWFGVHGDRPPCNR